MPRQQRMVTCTWVHTSCFSECALCLLHGRWLEHQACSKAIAYAHSTAHACVKAWRAQTLQSLASIVAKVTNSSQLP